MEDRKSNQEGSEKISRIAQLQNFINFCQINKDYNNWFAYLSALFTEVFPKMSIKERNKGRLQMCSISGKLSMYNVFFPNSSQKYIAHNISKNLYSTLFDFDCWLREMIDKHHLGISDMNEGDF